MKKKTACLMALMIGSVWVFSPTIQAAEEIKMETVEEVPAEPMSRSDKSNADDWFDKQDSGRDKDARSSDADSEDKKKKKKERFQVIYQDDSFVYWMDTERTRWIPLPYSTSEKIIDAWVKMLDTTGEYSYPQKYYLEHYYIRPKRQQIQFLCELEVTGHPQNDIKERDYNTRNWENLVPDSVEEHIYNGVLGYMKSKEAKNPLKKLPGFRDAMDKWFNIGI